MGKMKRPRQKLHAAAVRAKIKEQNKVAGQKENVMDVVQEAAVPSDPTAAGHRGESLFQNVQISSSALVKQVLPDFDACSTITSKTFRGQNIKKKDKLKIRHEAWITKIDTIQKTKRKAKERKRKQQTPIVGDLSAMEDALPTLELLLKKSVQGSDKSQTTEKPRSIPKEKRRKKQMLDDIALFKKVVEHPVFQDNASEAIKEHVKLKLKAEAEQMDI